MEKTLDVLVGHVLKNMRARASGVTAEYAKQTIEDVLDALAGETWGAQFEAELCQSDFKELCDG
jgi:hypothetical protein